MSVLQEEGFVVAENQKRLSGKNPFLFLVGAT